VGVHHAHVDPVRGVEVERPRSQSPQGSSDSVTGRSQPTTARHGGVPSRVPLQRRREASNLSLEEADSASGKRPAGAGAGCAGWQRSSRSCHRSVPRRALGPRLQEIGGATLSEDSARQPMPHDSRGRSGLEQFGTVEDDNLRAEVRTNQGETHVRLEGRLDASGAPVVGELLAAVERWHTIRRRRGPARRGVGPDPAAGSRSALEVDLTAVEQLDPAGWEVIDQHLTRWRSEHGPCRVSAPQGSRR
jgi:hypothetical protein